MMRTVTFFTRSNCPLCESAWFVVQKLRSRVPFDLQRVDITEPCNERWYALYVNDIPVVHIDGREVFKHRVSERALRERLEDDARPDASPNSTQNDA